MKSRSWLHVLGLIALVAAAFVLVPLGADLARRSAPAAPTVPHSPALPTTQPAQAGTLPFNGSIAWVETLPQAGRSTLWRAPVSDLGQAAAIAEVEHRPGYPPRGFVSPDGQWIAFQVVPPDASERAARTNAGELWLLPAGGGQPERIATGLDRLRGWSPDGQSLIYTSQAALEQPTDPLIPDRTDLYQVDLATRRPRLLLSDQSSYGVTPLGWTADQRRYWVARVSLDGAWDAAPWDAKTGRLGQPVALPAAALVRDLQLAPDGSAVLLSVLRGGQAELVTVDLASGAAVTLASAPQGDSQTSPLAGLWSADGRRVLHTTIASLGEHSTRRVIALEPNPRADADAAAVEQAGVVIPLAVSPDGQWLITRDYAAEGAPLRLERSAGSPVNLLPQAAPGARHNFLGWIP